MGYLKSLDRYNVWIDTLLLLKFVQMAFNRIKNIF